MSDIAPRERLDRVLGGQSVDRPPVICTGGMMNAAVLEVTGENAPALPAAHFDAERMATLAEQVHAATGFENLGVPFCMTVEPEVLGSRIDPGTLACEPKVAEEAFRSCEAVEYGDPAKLVREGGVDVLSPTCGMSSATPLENILAMTKAAKKRAEEREEA